MKISLNLASRPYTDVGPTLRRLRIAIAVSLLLLIALLWALHSFHQAAVALAARQAELDRDIAQIRDRQQSFQAQMRLPDNARVLTQAEFLNSLFDEKSFSWTVVMEDLEPVLPAGVQVTAIEPSRARSGILTLRLRVAGPRDRAVEMVRNMEHSRRFLAPRITGENAESTGNQGDLLAANVNGRVSFEILAEYNPPTLAERAATQKSQPQGVAR